MSTSSPPNYGPRASSSQEASILQQSRFLLGPKEPFRTRHKTLHLIGTGTPRTTLIPLDCARSALAPPYARRNCKMLMRNANVAWNGGTAGEDEAVLDREDGRRAR